MNDTEDIDISGLDKADVLAAFYNRASPGGPQSLGWLHYTPESMTYEEASRLITEALSNPHFQGEVYFDYLYGRCLKIGFKDNKLRCFCYDRDYGEGVAQRIIDMLRGQDDND